MPERRTAAKLIRFHPTELARITARAQACGQTPARFIRETALGSIPKARHDAVTVPLVSELARIGRSLDQLARLAQAGQDAALAKRVRGALDEHWALARQVIDGRRRSASRIAR